MIYALNIRRWLTALSISKTFVKLVIEKTIAYKENKKAAARRKQGENAVDRLSSQEAGLSFSVSALRPRTSSVSSSESDKESITAWHGDLRPNLQHKYIKAQSMARQHAAPVAYMARYASHQGKLFVLKTKRL